MKALLTFLMILFCGELAAAGAIKTGSYALTGCNPDGTSYYYGEVIISPQGTNYNLQWKIGRNQAQTGVGVICDNVLAVAYQDNFGRDFGVVAFEIIDEGHLQGKWASMSAKVQGQETLQWKISWKEE